MTEQTQEMQNNEFRERAEELKQKAVEMEAQVSENIDELMNRTAENLDKAADKMRDTADFFRNKNVSMFKEDFSGVIKKNPGKSLAGAAFLGFLLGKILLR